ncbi:MAG: hypothetical protein KGD67_07375 [Candidatus Lokiarchaeota archaeon]|nr:hypothetical protein [Candidatus Lokiarchaeota archaeon]
MALNTNIKQLHLIVSALERFKTRKNNLFSLDKLTAYLNITDRELEEVLELLFRFQHLFSVILDDHILCKKWRNDKCYLILKLKSDITCLDSSILKEAEINQTQVNLLSDVIYYFQHVKIGKGFTVRGNGTELSKKVKQLNRSHPYFFEHRGNGLIYPSKLAVEAGKLIQSYNRSKKKLSKFQIEDFIIQIV